MKYKSIARFVRYSPYKLRPIADVVRGKMVPDALGWLTVHANKRVVAIKKAIESAAANAKQLDNYQATELVVKELRVDEGPSFRYLKAGAMGRSQIQRRRLSHVQVILENVQPVTSKRV
jgi:large subunit ribosomal protein L22